MAAGDLSLNILIRATNSTGGVIGDLVSKLGPVGVGLVAISAAAIDVGVVATKMEASFQTAMLSNEAHAGLAKSQFDSVSASVLAMSAAVGRSPTQLAEALYPILSAFSGIQNQSAKSALALDTLKMSFETVAGTTVNGTDVANAAVGTFNALGLSTNNVAENTRRMTNIFDVMDKTVQLGNMQWDTYKNVVSKLAVAIQGTNVTFNESQAALAEMTNEGFSAQKASTYLANAFTTLVIKTDTLAKHAASLKIPFNESAYAGMDLAHKIEYLNQVTDGNKQKLLALMSNNATALKTFNALSVGIGGYKTNLDALNHSQGALAQSFATASQGFDVQLAQLKGAGEALMITLGTRLLPIASAVVSAITPIVTGFTQWITSSNGLSSVLNSLAPVGRMIASIWNQVVLAFQSEQFAEMIDTVSGAINSLLIPAFRAFSNAVQSIVKPAVAFFSSSQVQAISYYLNVAFVAITRVAQAFQTVFFPIQRATAVAKPLLDTFDRATGVFHFVTAAAAPLLDTFDRGTDILKKTDTAAAPLLDTFDRATAVFHRTGAGASTVTKAVNPWIAIFREVAAAIKTTVAVISTVISIGASVVNTVKQIWAAFASSGALKAIWGILVQLWQFIIAQFVPIWHQLVRIWTGELLPAFKEIWSALVTLKPLFELIGIIVGVVLVVALGLFIGILEGVIKALASLLTGVAMIIGGIVRVFTGFLEIIGGVIRIIIDLCTGNFSDLGSALGEIWQGIINIFKGAWDIIKGLFVSVFGTLWGLISGFVTGIISFFMNMYNALVGHSIIPDMVNGIVKWFENLIPRAIGAVRSLIGQLMSMFGGLANAAVSWGVNLIQGFINGITSMLSAVGNTASNVMSTVKNYLGFHSPAKEGEGRYIIEWGQGMVKGFVQGMQQAQPLLNAQVSHMISAPGNLAYAGSRAGNAFALGSTSASSGPQSVNLTIQLDGKTITEAVGVRMAREMRIQGQVKNR